MSRPSPMAMATATEAHEAGFSLDHPELALGLGTSLRSLLEAACRQVVLVPCSEDDAPVSSGYPTMWA